jgi:ASPIC and UnbV
VHFGLGDATKVENVEIHWPSGAVERLNLPAVDRYYSVEEGRGIVAGALDPKTFDAGGNRLQGSLRKPVTTNPFEGAQGRLRCTGEDSWGESLLFRAAGEVPAVVVNLQEWCLVNVY